MKTAVRLSLVPLLLFSQAAWARPKSLTVTSAGSPLKPVSLVLREQSTRPWLVGCMWPDVLQNSGWFPATFYFESKGKSVGADVTAFEFKKRSPLAVYCDARTDNVANSLSFESYTANGEIVDSAGLSYVLGTGPANTAEVHCRISDAGGFACDSASFNDEENLFLTVIFES